MKAFSILAILTAAVGTVVSGCQAYVDVDKHPSVLLWASDQLAAGAYLFACVASLIVWATWADYVQGPANTSAGCGLDGDGDVGISFILFILSWLALGFLAVVYILRVIR